MSEPHVEKQQPVPPFMQFCCAAVPMVFDDSLSYYEALCALWKYLDETRNVVNNNATVTEDYIRLTNEMKTYMDTYFDNLNVQSEINNKLDQMAASGELTAIIASYVNSYTETTVEPRLNSQDNKIAHLEDQVGALGSFAPIPVATTAAMTDTSKVYVLTTDGKWYYYDTSTSTWVAGGTYQSVALGLNSVSLGNLTSSLAGAIYHASSDITKLGGYLQNNNANSYKYTTPMLIKSGTTITLSDDFVSNYHWHLRRMAANGLEVGATIFGGESTNTTYTFVNDEYCALCWRPLDNNWNTSDYTVDIAHNLDNDDVTAITFYYPDDNRFKLIDIDSSLFSNQWSASTDYGTTLSYYSNNRLNSTKIHKSIADILVHLNISGYQYAVHYWDGNGEDATRTYDSGWKTDDVIIPAGTYFTFVVRDPNNTSFFTAFSDQSWKDILTLNSYCDYNYAKAYIDNHISSIGDEYNYEGINLDMQYKHGYEYTASINIPSDYRGMQGFAIYGNYLVQLYANGNIVIFNLTNGNIESVIGGLTIGHGDSCQFSNTFYDENDPLPLLYVTTNTSPQICVVRFITLANASVIKAYDLGSESGYYTGQSFDFDNGIVYNFGYKQNSYSDATDNNMIVSVFNLYDETQYSGNIYKLGLIERYEIPFIYCIQGQTFLNGKCWLCSSYQTNVVPTNIYVYDPYEKSIVADFPSLPMPLRGEMEGIDFVKNTSTGKYDAIIAVSGDPNYWKLSFM